MTYIRNAAVDEIDTPTVEDWLDIVFSEAQKIERWDAARSTCRPENESYRWYTDRIALSERRIEDAREHILDALRRADGDA